MKFVVLCLLLAFACCDHWAVLVAGSSSWSNYRHQADVYHAYQVLRKGGFPEDRIITFAYDDIADNTNNPYKGKVFNKPTYSDPGVDVYEGVKIDYSKADVTPEHFLAVLEGDAAKVKGKGTGRVLGSTDSDNVFIFFSDHGAPGLIAFPRSNLYATNLLSTFTKMQQNGKYKKLVFYLEVFIHLFSLANQAQCSLSYQTTPASMPYQLPILLSLHGDATALLMMSLEENISSHAWVIFSQSTSSRTLKREISTRLSVTNLTPLRD
jgi:uncharacterized integral membrane protein